MFDAADRRKRNSLFACRFSMMRDIFATSLVVIATGVDRSKAQAISMEHEGWVARNPRENKAKLAKQPRGIEGISFGRLGCEARG